MKVYGGEVNHVSISCERGTYTCRWAEFYLQDVAHVDFWLSVSPLIYFSFLQCFQYGMYDRCGNETSTNACREVTVYHNGSNARTFSLESTSTAGEALYSFWYLGATISNTVSFKKLLDDAVFQDDHSGGQPGAFDFYCGACQTDIVRASRC